MHSSHLRRFLIPDTVTKRWTYAALILFVLSRWIEPLRVVAYAMLVVSAGGYLWKYRNLLFWKVRSRLLASFVFIGLVPLCLFTGIALIVAWFGIGAMSAAQINRHFEQNLERLGSVPRLFQQALYYDTLRGESSPPWAVNQVIDALQIPQLSFALFEQREEGWLLTHTSAGRAAVDAPPDWYSGETLTSMFLDRNGISFRTLMRLELDGRDVVLIASLPLSREDQHRIWAETGVFFYNPGPGRGLDAVDRVWDRNLFDPPSSLQNAALPEMPRDDLPLWTRDFRLTWGGIFPAIAWDKGPVEQVPGRIGFLLAIDPFRVIHEARSQDYDQAPFLLGILLVLSGVLLVVILVAFVIGIIISRRITTAVDNLSQGTRALEEGNLDFRIETGKHDQLGELGYSFNRMAQNIQDLLAELKAHADELEERVAERTAEIERSLEELKATQSQLVQTEKMAALGKLVAGVVHEMNTPLGTINSAIDVSTRCVETIVDTLESGASIDEIKNNSVLRRALQTLPNGNRVTVDASERLSRIVSSLKSFTRLDEATFQEVDLHEGLDSTLTLLEHEFLDRIHVIKEYGDLPAVACYPGEINQVFMHLLTNAAQAIPESGTITIRTSVDRDRVTIRIEDTGIGMTPEQINEVFNPRFTREKSRVKAGFGLFTCYNIIEKHHGRITLDSAPGKGATVTVTLPVYQAPPKPQDTNGNRAPGE